MDKKTYNKFNQVWKMFYSNQPMPDWVLELVCEQSNVSTEEAKEILELKLGLWVWNIDKLIELDL